MHSGAGVGAALEFSVDRWLRRIAILLGVVLVSHTILQVIEHTWRVPVLGMVARMLHPGIEGSAATWFSSALLASAAVGGWLIARQDTGRARWWYAIAAILLLMSIDEVAVGHESLSEPLRTTFDLPDFLYFAWVIPVGIALIIGLAVAVPFIRSLDPWIRNRLILGGLVFVAGAIGMELPGAALGAQSLNESAEYTAIVTIEESLEMIGALIAGSALLRRGAALTSQVNLQTRAPLVTG